MVREVGKRDRILVVGGCLTVGKGFGLVKVVRVMSLILPNFLPKVKEMGRELGEIKARVEKKGVEKVKLGLKYVGGARKCILPPIIRESTLVSVFGQNF